MLNNFIQWKYSNTYFSSCMCSVAPNNIFKLVLNLIQNLQFYGFQIIACNFCLLEHSDRKLRKLFHKYFFFSFRTNISWISATKNKMRHLYFNCYTVRNTKWGKRHPVTYILPLPTTAAGQKLLIWHCFIIHSSILKGQKFLSFTLLVRK